MRPRALGPVIIVLAAWVVSCDRTGGTGPPEIRLGESTCAECGMIISEERYAAAILVRGDRGPEPYLYDDFGDLLAHEEAHPEFVVLGRYVKARETKEWLEVSEAVFILAEDLRTPMASGIAAFADRTAAEALQREVGGKILRYEGLVGAR